MSKLQIWRNYLPITYLSIIIIQNTLKSHNKKINHPTQQWVKDKNRHIPKRRPRCQERPRKYFQNGYSLGSRKLKPDKQQRNRISHRLKNKVEPTLWPRNLSPEYLFYECKNLCAPQKHKENVYSNFTHKCLSINE